MTHIRPTDIDCMPVRLRRARPTDRAAIEGLVRGERRLNPNDLAWHRFIVATAGERVVGAVQMRDHADGSRELGSLVVAKAWRGRGIAGRLIHERLKDHHGPVHVITAAVNAVHYRRWSFRTIDPALAPCAVRRNHWFGRIAGFVFGLLRGYRPRRLAILERTLAS